MEIIIISIILVLGIITYGLFIRKKIYEEVDRVESWKIDIMNRPVTDEISKVKKLNMTGQTEEKFDGWRETWDDIVTVKLPEVEEKLFDAEEAADRYRFKKAKHIIKEMKNILDQVESEISQVLTELQELVGSEEQSRIDIEELKFALKKARKTLLTERHSFGKVEARLELELDEIEERFNDYEEETEGGNYLEAREIVLKLRTDLEVIEEKIEVIPRLLHECVTEIPSQLQELRNGYVEMEQEGYVLEGLRVDDELRKIKEEATSLLQHIEKAEIQTAGDGVADLKERLEQIYDMLEQEVLARHQIAAEGPNLQPQLQQLQEEVQQTKQEAEYVQYTYQLSEEDIIKLNELEVHINKAIKQSDMLQEKIKENAIPSSNLQSDLEHIINVIASIKESHTNFQKMLKTLRKDEVTAKEKISEIRKVLLEAKRLVLKSNLPGLPEHYIVSYESAQESINDVFSKLEEKPLNMAIVHESLNEAVEKVDKVFEQTKETIDNAALTEKVIQYGNRYRSQFPFISAKLSEAEHSFRMFDYDTALEQAATAIEEIEPGAMKKLNNLLEITQEEDLVK